MKTHISIAVAIAALAASSIRAQAQDEPDQTQFPKISRQPVDEAVHAGGRHVLSVEATNADSFQWYRNGAALDGQTNSQLVLENMNIKDVGYYQCNVVKGDEAVPTRTANVNMFTTLDFGGGGQITVYGTPMSGGGGTTNSCPGTYVGYVNYVKTGSAWGWIPSTGTSIHTVTDTNRNNTWVTYVGRYGTDFGCGLTTVAVPHPPSNPKYRFSIYFPNNLPTNAYPIVLEGFDP